VITLDTDPVDGGGFLHVLHVLDTLVHCLLVPEVSSLLGTADVAAAGDAADEADYYGSEKQVLFALRSRKPGYFPPTDANRDAYPDGPPPEAGVEVDNRHVPHGHVLIVTEKGKVDGSVDTDEEELDDDDNEPETAQAQVAPPGTKVRHLGRNINSNY